MGTGQKRIQRIVFERMIKTLKKREVDLGVLKEGRAFLHDPFCHNKEGRRHEPDLHL